MTGNQEEETMPVFRKIEEPKEEFEPEPVVEIEAETEKDSNSNQKRHWT